MSRADRPDLATCILDMRFRNPEIGMGGTDVEREYTNQVTDEDAVRSTIAAARA